MIHLHEQLNACAALISVTPGNAWDFSLQIARIIDDEEGMDGEDVPMMAQPQAPQQMPQANPGHRS